MQPAVVSMQSSDGVPNWAIGLAIAAFIAYLFKDEIKAYMNREKQMYVAPVVDSGSGVKPLPVSYGPPAPVVESKPAPAVVQNPKWQFYQGLDSNGYDVGMFSGDLASMKAKCMSMPDCLGFNDNGWMKNHLRPKSEWEHWTDDPNKGFRVPIDRVGDLPGGGVAEL